jgi:hypothetical protein
MITELSDLCWYLSLTLDNSWLLSPHISLVPYSLTSLWDSNYMYITWFLYYTTDLTWFPPTLCFQFICFLWLLSSLMLSNDNLLKSSSEFFISDHFISSIPLHLYDYYDPSKPPISLSMFSISVRDFSIITIFFQNLHLLILVFWPRIFELF